MKKAFSDNNKKIANINAQLQDSLAGIRVVKSFANETVEKEKFQKANVSFLSSKKQVIASFALFFTITFLKSFSKTPEKYVAVILLLSI